MVMKLFFRLQVGVATILLIFCLATNKVSSTIPGVSGGNAEEECPPCEMLFSKLERTGKNGKLAQDVRVQERGEPKSGTGVLYFWTTASLLKTRDYLRGLFGHRSCRVEFFSSAPPVVGPLVRYSNESLIFEPSLGGSDARCSCDTIDRVSITTSSANKHNLPVVNRCAFSHKGGMGIKSGGRSRDPPCTFADGTAVNNNDDLWRCMHEANCEITDDWIQMAVFRDPRPATVSSFYHVQVHANRDVGNLHDFVTRELPISCQWLTIRYILFTGILAHQSMDFWYNDALDDPLGWHFHWLNSVGLQLPFHIVEGMTQAALADDLGFHHKDVDVHPGEAVETVPGMRRFEDEVSPETAAIAEDVLRTWLHPVLLERFGVGP